MIDFEFEFQYAEEKQPTLQKVGGSIPAGRCVVLCGGSGCGKSTLLRCINGLIPQFYEGELKGFCRLNGQDTAGIRIGEIGELAASVFQDPRSQFFTVNSSNEVAFGLENHGLPQDKIRRRVDEAFRIFHLERLKDRNVYELSSGERQLISILSAWAMDTDIFLLDEPRFRKLLADNAANTWPGCEEDFKSRDASLDLLAETFHIRSRDPFQRVKELQTGFDPSVLNFSDAYYDTLGLEKPKRGMQRKEKPLFEFPPITFDLYQEDDP